MNRPNFVPGSAPAEWLVTPRTGESPARRAYAVFKCQSESRVTEIGHRAVQYFCAAIIGGCVAVVLFK